MAGCMLMSGCECINHLMREHQDALVKFITLEALWLFGQSSSGRPLGSVILVDVTCTTYLFPAKYTPRVCIYGYSGRDQLDNIPCHNSKMVQDWFQVHNNEKVMRLGKLGDQSFQLNIYGMWWINWSDPGRSTLQLSRVCDWWLSADTIQSKVNAFLADQSILAEYTCFWERG